MKKIILHLSDIHIRNGREPILRKASHISRCLYELMDDESIIFVLISGDIAFSGKPDEYVAADVFLKELKSEILKERNIPVNIITCPGNHDCDFTPNSTRDFILKNIDLNNVDDLEKGVLDTCLTHQDEYFKFKGGVESNIVEDDRIWSTSEFKYNDETIVFESVNLAWASNINEEQGRLSYPFKRYEEKSSRSADLRISLMHHPLNWLSQISYRDYRKIVRNMSDIVFTGHEHHNNAINHDDNESGRTVIIEGGELFGTDIKNSSFGIVLLSSEDNFHRTYNYQPDLDRYVLNNEKELDFTKDSSERSFYRFTKEFQDKIDDCGGYFKHSNTTDIALSDIFIYPSVKVESDVESSEKSKVLSSRILLSPTKLGKGTVLSGENNMGRTSLLYMLMMEYLANGYIPVLLRGASLVKNSKSNMDLQIQRALSYEYKNENINDLFNQELKSKKMLLIDDFDDSKVRSEKSRREMLEYLSEKFDKIIISVDDSFEVGELTSLEGKSLGKDFEHYKLEQFGYKKRTQLINKWYSLGQQDDETESELIGKCDVAERLMDSVMDKSLIAPHPIYLLTFLQSIETNQSSQLVDSALGAYYYYLLTSSLLDVGISSDSLRQELDYAMHLARFFNERETDSITEEEFVEFNEYFTDVWQKTDFEKKKRTLLKSKILVSKGSEYSFRYMYNYYYLLGEYLSQRLLEEDVVKEVSHYINHLYVKKYANTILFLAHHTTSDNILFLMKTAADRLFEDLPPADLNGGCEVVHELIKSAPKLKYNNRSPEDNRAAISENRDLIESRKPDVEVIDEEKDLSTLDLATKITMLFKTIDILSQIIKSNPTKYERNKKVDVLKSIYNAPLRALQDFYEFLNSHKSTLMDAINDELSHKSLSDTESDDLARLTVSRIIQALSSAFIIKTAQISNSENLMPDISNAISEESTLSKDLIYVSILLDNHRPIERRKIKQVYNKCKENLIAQKIFDVIIMNRLQLFKTSEQDMQWLQSELNYSLTAQHQIGYNPQNKISKLA